MRAADAPQHSIADPLPTERLEDRALAAYRENRERVKATKLERMRTQREVCQRVCARILGCRAHELDMDLQYGKSEGDTWIFRHAGFDWWAKYVGGQQPCQLYVVDAHGGGLPVDRIEDLGRWIHEGHVRARA